ncbi:hypothetical protein [Microvirga arabica]|uniref:hypothetical protein n=1 Tax=Microvirga arabica TaxID=1128671 RepID=UPI001939681A|nr:hypothetical protein [Microvirga arabica]MBM1171128.1 hypothetical protein [Microvirga arabica]
MSPRPFFLHGFLSIGILVAAPPAAIAQALGEWRALTAEEEQARIGDTPSGETDPSMIEADFDGDGRQDRALVAVRRSNGARGLVVATRGKVQVIKPEDVEPQDGLRLAAPGPWDTVCGNAFRAFHQGTCNDGYPSRVELRNPGILWIGNGRTVLYYWDGKTNRFSGVLMVD